MKKVKIKWLLLITLVISVFNFQQVNAAISIGTKCTRGYVGSFTAPIGYASSSSGFEINKYNVTVNGQTFNAFCLDPGSSAVSSVKIAADFNANSNDKVLNAYYKGLLAILKEGYHDGQEQKTANMYSVSVSDYTDLTISNNNYWAATSIALRTFTDAMGRGHGNSYSNTINIAHATSAIFWSGYSSFNTDGTANATNFDTWYKAFYGKNFTGKNNNTTTNRTEMTYSVVGPAVYQKLGWASSRTALENDLNKYKFIETEKNYIVYDWAYYLFQKGLDAAYDSYTATSTTSTTLGLQLLSKGDIKKNQIDDNNTEYSSDNYYLLDLSKIDSSLDASKVLIDGFSIASANSSSFTLSYAVGTVDGSNYDSLNYQPLSATKNVMADKASSLDGKIYLKVHFSKIETNLDEEECGVINYKINFEYSGLEGSYDGYLVSTVGSYTNSTQRYVFYVNGGTNGKNNSSISDTIDICKNKCSSVVTVVKDCTELSDANMWENTWMNDSTKTSSISGPDNIVGCILNKTDDADNSYLLSEDNGGVSADNAYCQIYCKEDYSVLKFSGIQTTTSGRYFRLAGHIEGTKICYTGKGNINNKTNAIDVDGFKNDLRKALMEQFNYTNEYITALALSNAIQDSDRVDYSDDMSIKDANNKVQIDNLKIYQTNNSNIINIMIMFNIKNIGYSTSDSLSIDFYDGDALVEEIPVDSTIALNQSASYRKEFPTSTVTKVQIKDNKNSFAVTSSTITSVCSCAATCSKGVKGPCYTTCAGPSADTYTAKASALAMLYKNTDDGLVPYFDTVELSYGGNGSCTCSSGCSGMTSPSDAESGLRKIISDNLKNAQKQLQASIESTDIMIKNIKDCSSWNVKYDKDYFPNIYYDYSEAYADLLKKTSGADLMMAQNYSSKSQVSSYCNGNIDKKYNCQIDTTTEPTTEKVMTYTFDTSGKLNTVYVDIPTSKYVKKYISATSEYTTPVQFENIYTSGVITINDVENSGLNPEVQATDVNGLPVALKTEKGVYTFNFEIRKLGQYYDQSSDSGPALGRLVNSENPDKSVIQKITKDDEMLFNGDYICYYTVNCPECEVKCETEEHKSCEWCIGDNCCPTGENCSCPNCEVTCVNCVYDLSSLQINFRAISSTNVNPNNRELGYNWNVNAKQWNDSSSSIQWHSSTKYDLIGDKASATINEITESGESIYDETPILTVNMTPSVASEIKSYNATNSSNGGYANNSLTCYDYINNDSTYKNVFCFSGFLDEMSKNLPNSFIFNDARTNLGDSTSRTSDYISQQSVSSGGYWQVYTEATSYGISAADNVYAGGVSWK